MAAISTEVLLIKRQKSLKLKPLKLTNELLNKQNNVSFISKKTNSEKTSDKSSSSEDSQQSLNSWIRQQGSFVLPKIPTKTTFSRSNSKIKLVNVKQSDKKPVTPQDRFNFSSQNIYGGPDSRNEIPDGAKTPFPSNSFYTKCIDEVFSINQPKNLKLKDPKELLYIQNLPTYTFSTYGVGKTLGSSWQISTVYDQPRFEKYSVIDNLSLRNKIER